MLGTALIYSSHNRSDYIHDHFIVQRALRGNHRILFLPMSETIQNGSEMERQEYSWGTFRWYFDFFKKYGLEYTPFYWRSNLSKRDVDYLWYQLATAEVVILGGGNSYNGLERYKRLGAEFDGEWGKFGRLLHERQQRKMLTVGFSAGADQLGQTLFRASYGSAGHNDAFGLVRNTMCTLHHDPSRDEDLIDAARQFPHCMMFGLPNDAGLNVDQGVLPSGNWWQAIEFVVDGSWDDPKDQFHIRTRQGAGIEHFSRDGRRLTFRGGERMLRIQSGDNRFQEAWFTNQGRLIHYGTLRPSSFSNFGQILARH